MKKLCIICLFLCIFSCQNKSNKSLKGEGGVVLSYSSTRYPSLAFPVYLESLVFVDGKKNFFTVKVGKIINLGLGEQLPLGGYNLPAKSYQAVKVKFSVDDPSLMLYGFRDSEIFYPYLVDSENRLIPKSRSGFTVSIDFVENMTVTENTIGFYDLAFDLDQSLSKVSIKNQNVIRFTPHLSMNAVRSLPVDGHFFYKGGREAKVGVGELPVLNAQLKNISYKNRPEKNDDEAIQNLNDKTVGMILRVDDAGILLASFDISQVDRAYGWLKKDNGVFSFSGLIKTPGGSFSYATDALIDELGRMQCFYNGSSVSTDIIMSGQPVSLFLDGDETICVLSTANVVGKVLKVSNGFQVLPIEIDRFPAEFLTPDILQIYIDISLIDDFVVGDFVSIKGNFVRQVSTNFTVTHIEKKILEEKTLKIEFNRVEKTYIAFEMVDSRTAKLTFIDDVSSMSDVTLLTDTNIAQDAVIESIIFDENTDMLLAIDNVDEVIHRRASDIEMFLKLAQYFLNSGERRIFSLYVNGWFDGANLKANKITLSLQRPFFFDSGGSDIWDYFVDINYLEEIEAGNIDVTKLDIKSITSVTKLSERGIYMPASELSGNRFFPPPLKQEGVLLGRYWQLGVLDKVHHWWVNSRGPLDRFRIWMIEKSGAGFGDEFTTIYDAEEIIIPKLHRLSLNRLQRIPSELLDEKDALADKMWSYKLKSRILFDGPTTLDYYDIFARLPSSMKDIERLVAIDGGRYMVNLDGEKGKELSSWNYDEVNNKWSQEGQTLKELDRIDINDMPVNKNSFGDSWWNVIFQNDGDDPENPILKNLNYEDVVEGANPQKNQQELAILTNQLEGELYEQYRLNTIKQHPIETEEQYLIRLKGYMYAAIKDIQYSSDSNFISLTSVGDPGHRFYFGLEQYKPLGGDVKDAINTQRFMEDLLYLYKSYDPKTDEPIHFGGKHKSTITKQGYKKHYVSESRELTSKHKLSSHEAMPVMVFKDITTNKKQGNIIVRDSSIFGKWPDIDEAQLNSYKIKNGYVDGEVNDNPIQTLKIHILLSKDAEAMKVAYADYFKNPRETAIVILSADGENCRVLKGNENLSKVGKQGAFDGTSWAIHGKVTDKEFDKYIDFNAIDMDYFKRVKRIESHKAKALGKIAANLPDMIKQSLIVNKPNDNAVNHDIEHTKSLQPSHILFSSPFAALDETIMHRSYINRFSNEYYKHIDTDPVVEAYKSYTRFTDDGRVVGSEKWSTVRSRFQPEDHVLLASEAKVAEVRKALKYTVGLDVNSALATKSPTRFYHYNNKQRVIGR